MPLAEAMISSAAELGEKTGLRKQQNEKYPTPEFFTIEAHAHHHCKDTIVVAKCLEVTIGPVTGNGAISKNVKKPRGRRRATNGKYPENIIRLVFGVGVPNVG